MTRAFWVTLSVIIKEVADSSSSSPIAWQREAGSPETTGERVSEADTVAARGLKKRAQGHAAHTEIDSVVDSDTGDS